MKLLTSLALVACCCVAIAQKSQHEELGMTDYRQDIEEAIRCVARNYAGYDDKRERFGPATIDAATTLVKAAATNIASDAECADVINRWLNVFHDGHLTLFARQGEGKWFDYTWSKRHEYSAPPTQWQSIEPTGTAVSKDTFVLRIPSFDVRCKARIDDLIKRSQVDITQRRSLIIDLRGNGGGCDASYGLLSRYLYTQPVVMIGVDALATRENVDAWKRLLAQIPEQETATRKSIIQVCDMLRNTREGSFVSMVEDQTLTLDEVLLRPSRIGILVDRNCASTTEQFLLEAKQSRKVTIFGERTAGILDYANVCVFRLPSGKRALQIPTTRSRRLPAAPVDDVGIIPDVEIEGMEISNSVHDAAIDFVLNYWKARSASEQ